jgi:hypothetical protein
MRSAPGKDGMRHTALQARGNGLDLPYRHWLAGYLTAVTKLTKAMVNMRGTTHIDGMLWLLEQYCIKHRQRSSVTPWNPWWLTYTQSAGRTCPKSTSDCPRLCAVGKEHLSMYSWGSVSKVEIATPRGLIYKVLFPSISTFETPSSWDTLE